MVIHVRIIAVNEIESNDGFKRGKRKTTMQHKVRFYFCLMIESRGTVTARAKGVNRLTWPRKRTSMSDDLKLRFLQNLGPALSFGFVLVNTKSLGLNDPVKFTLIERSESVTGLVVVTRWISFLKLTYLLSNYIVENQKFVVLLLLLLLSLNLMKYVRKPKLTSTQLVDGCSKNCIVTHK